MLTVAEQEFLLNNNNNYDKIITIDITDNIKSIDNMLTIDVNAMPAFYSEILLYIIPCITFDKCTLTDLNNITSDVMERSYITDYNVSNGYFEKLFNIKQNLLYSRYLEITEVCTVVDINTSNDRVTITLGVNDENIHT